MSTPDATRLSRTDAARLRNPIIVRWRDSAACGVIRPTRRTLLLSVRQTAARLGMAHGTYTSVERGMLIPLSEQALKIQALFGLNDDWLAEVLRFREEMDAFRKAHQARRAVALQEWQRQHRTAAASPPPTSTYAPPVYTRSLYSTQMRAGNGPTAAAISATPTPPRDLYDEEFEAAQEMHRRDAEAVAVRDQASLTKLLQNLLEFYKEMPKENVMSAVATACKRVGIKKKD